MEIKLIDKILKTLEQRAPVRKEGKGWRTHCPNPGHEDVHLSLSLYTDGGGQGIDITKVMVEGFSWMYIVAVFDWYIKKIVSWRR